MSPLRKAFSPSRLPVALAALALLGLPAARAAAPEPAKDDGQGQNVALLSLGATAKGISGNFNKDWPVNNALLSTPTGGGILSAPLPGTQVDIRLIVPVDIKAIEVVGLDYHGTLQPKAIDIFLDGKMEKHVDLPETPAKPFRIPLEGHAQIVGIKITDIYPIRTMPDGTQGSNYGGWQRLRVLSMTDVPGMLKPVDKYEVPALPVNIAPTGGSEATGGVPEVYGGEPRNTVGHPCTLWDKEDIAHFQDMLKTSRELQTQFNALKKSLDLRITEPTGVPQPIKGADGKFRHVSDTEKAPDGRTYGAVHNQLGLDIANLGTIYALTGEAKYAEYAKKILLDYATAYPDYAIGARPGFAHAPAKIFDQELGDVTWLIPVARGYDYIHDYPNITPEERRHIEDDFLRVAGHEIIRNHSMLEAATNWSSIGTCALLTTGYAIDDADLIHTATYGIKGTPEKPHGGFYLHFSEKSISPDGLWDEGAMGYQFMAMQALVMDAEVLWHHGIDMYRYRDGAFKRLFDSPLQFAYPEARLDTPALHDSGGGSILGPDSFIYEYGYRRYRDPNYLIILNQVGTHLDTHFQQYTQSVLYDRDRAAKTPPAEFKSVNFFDVGYGALRLTTEAGAVSALLEYGPPVGHGHPDKLTLDLYAQGAPLMPDPGIVWYELPMYRRWFRTTLAHPTLVVDELDQNMSGAHLATFGPAQTMGIQRAWCQEAYPGVTMDRSIFVTPEYVADVFGAFARLPRKFDLAWHVRGDFASDLKLDAMTFPEPVENGYNELKNVRHTATSINAAWSATMTREGKPARLLVAGGAPTEIIVGDGTYHLEHPPTILERRTNGSTIYGNALDYSGAAEPYVKGVAQSGSLEDGYGLLTVVTVKGTDLCFASYHAGDYHAGELETDALQAFVQRDGPGVRNLYLGGGKRLKVPGAELARSESGLAYLEKTAGGYVLANPSPGDATVTVKLAALDNLEAFDLDAVGKRTGAAMVNRSADGVAVPIKASSRVEFAMKGSVGAYEAHQAMLAKRQADEEAAVAKARAEFETRDHARQSEAAAKPAPANTVLVVAGPSFSAQGGGQVTVSTNKRGAVGPTINQWNSEGQWIEWTFDAPADGYYHLTLCYCSENDQIGREVQVNGEVQEPFAPMVFPSTGGFSNGSDDWRLFTASLPDGTQPLLIKLKQGKNVIRLTNTNGRALNVNYVAVTSPDVKSTRETLAAKLPQ